MILSNLDIVVIALYVFLVFTIAAGAGHMISQRRKRSQNTLHPIENHYLAGKSITFTEALLSMVATEFSAIAFLSIPACVSRDNLTAINIVLGGCVSRVVIAVWVVPKLYNRGITIFQILTQSHTDPRMLPQASQAQRVLSAFYMITVGVGVAIRLLGGGILVSSLLQTPLFFTTFIIALLTYVYVALGGLKAVVQTDILQAGIFILGGILAHLTLSDLSDLSWGQLFVSGIASGKLSILHEGSLSGFVIGFISGFVFDAATHGLNQEFAQKLLGSRSMNTARRAVLWSAAGTVLINILFLSLGVVLWAYYHHMRISLPQDDSMLIRVVVDHFPSPLRGLIVASILAACMSTLDSAINALSVCWWNDVMRVKRTRAVRLYINIDNLIITLMLVLGAYVFSLSGTLERLGLFFSTLFSAPLLAFFIQRMFLTDHTDAGLTPTGVLGTMAFSSIAMVVGRYSAGWGEHQTMLLGCVVACCITYFHARVFPHHVSRRSSL